jgi:hypothetical protein
LRCSSRPAGEGAASRLDLTLKPRNVAWHSPGQPMMSGLRIALSIVALLQVVNPSPGADFTYQE